MSLLKFVVVHSTSSSSYDQLWGGAAAPAHRGAAAAPATNWHVMNMKCYLSSCKNINELIYTSGLR